MERRRRRKGFNLTIFLSKFFSTLQQNILLAEKIYIMYIQKKNVYFPNFLNYEKAENKGGK